MRKRVPSGSIAHCIHRSTEFISGTRADDCDPLDVLELIEEPSFSCCLIEVRRIGILNVIISRNATGKS